MDELILQGRVVISGEALGTVIVSREPLSFWGGYDWQTGEIIDRRHMLSGVIVKGKILAVPFTRGSSTTTAVLLESIRAGTAPAAIITTNTDFFFALASVVADELYNAPFPIMALNENDFAKLNSGDKIQIGKQGIVTIQKE